MPLADRSIGRVQLIAFAVFLTSFICLGLAAWYPPLKPEFIMEACKAAFYSSLGVLLGTHLGLERK